MFNNKKLFDLDWKITRKSFITSKLTIKIGIVLFLSILFNVACAQGTPQYKDGYIHFPEKPNEIMIRNDVHNDGTYDIIQKDLFEIVASKKRVIIIRQKFYGEGSSIFLEFYDFSGNLLSRSDELFGAFTYFTLEKQERFLAAQRTTHFVMDESFLFDFDGKQISTIKHHVEPKQVEATQDEKFILYVSNIMKNSAPYNLLEIFDVKSGLKIKEIEELESSCSIRIQGVNYYFKFSTPNVPG